MAKERWYAAQCIFLHSGTKRGPKRMYEERVVLFRAASFDGALEDAEKEAKDYCRDLDGCKFVGCVDVFHIYDGKIGSGTEIFSAMQRSDLKPAEYLPLHYPETPDDCEAIGESHRWRNLDGKRSMCYHCRVTREGQLWVAKKRRRR